MRTFNLWAAGFLATGVAALLKEKRLTRTQTRPDRV